MNTSLWGALGWAFVSVSGMPIGALIAASLQLTHTAVARTMSIAAGLLLSTAIVELAGEAIIASPSRVVAAAALVIGAFGFCYANGLLAVRGAADRKRCGECAAQPSEALNPGSGYAIALGTAIDAVPEAIVLGLTLKLQGPSAPLILAIALSNIPEAISGSAGMLEAGRAKRWVFGVWSLVALGGIALTLVGYLLAAQLTPWVIAVLKLLGAGALIAMVTETVIPEAVHGAPRYAGVIVTASFVVLLLVGLG